MTDIKHQKFGVEKTVTNCSVYFIDTINYVRRLIFQSRYKIKVHPRAGHEGPEGE